MVTVRYADKIPYVFILDYLSGVDIVIKPMFGCFGIYANGKLCLFLVRREAGPMQKGVYIATTTEHCSQLKTDFAEAEFDQLKGDKVWIFISEASEMFERYVIKACEMISSRDARVGR